MESLGRLSRSFSLLLIASAVIALGTAYTAQYVFGYEPCVLCLYQRVPYAIIGVIGIVTVYWCAPEKMHLVAVFACLVFLVSAGISFYHVVVEQTWWVSVAPCGGGAGDIASTQDLLAALQEKPAKSCGDIEWTLFGISMATYNVAVSLALAGTSFLGWRRMREFTYA